MTQWAAASLDNSNNTTHARKTQRDEITHYYPDKDHLGHNQKE